MDTQKDGLENVSPFKYGHFGVSMLNCLGCSQSKWSHHQFLHQDDVTWNTWKRIVALHKWLNKVLKNILEWWCKMVIYYGRIRKKSSHFHKQQEWQPQRNTGVSHHQWISPKTANDNAIHRLSPTFDIDDELEVVETCVQGLP